MLKKKRTLPFVIILHLIFVSYSTISSANPQSFNNFELFIHTTFDTISSSSTLFPKYFNNGKDSQLALLLSKQLKDTLEISLKKITLSVPISIENVNKTDSTLFKSNSYSSRN